MSAQTASSDELKPLKDTWRKHQVESPWLNQRVPDRNVLERFGVYCYNNPARKSQYSGRVMIPFTDLEGTLFGYMGRAVEGEPKYLVPTGFPKGRFLFGAHQLREGMPYRVVWLVESPFAVMKFAGFNIPAVSPYGWSVSDEQLQILQQLAKGVVYLCDRNKWSNGEAVAGKLAKRLWVRMPELPAGIEDPEALNHSQVLAL